MVTMMVVRLLRPKLSLDLVVLRGEFTVDQEAIVFGIENGGLVVLAGKRLHGIDRVPKREHRELRALIDIATEHPGAAAARRLRVAGETRFSHVLRVGVPFYPADSPFPDSSDHGASSSRDGLVEVAGAQARHDRGPELNELNQILRSPSTGDKPGRGSVAGRDSCGEPATVKFGQVDA